MSIDIFNRLLVGLARNLGLVLDCDAFLANFLHFLSRQSSLLMQKHCLFYGFLLLNSLFFEVEEFLARLIGFDLGVLVLTPDPVALAKRFLTVVIVKFLVCL